MAKKNVHSLICTQKKGLESEANEKMAIKVYAGTKESKRILACNVKLQANSKRETLCKPKTFSRNI